MVEGDGYGFCVCMGYFRKWRQTMIGHGKGELFYARKTAPDWVAVYTLCVSMCDLYNMRRTKATNENGDVMAIKGPLFSLFVFGCCCRC